MASNKIIGSKSLPLANYSSAIARAVEWLGDRYLLAKPINAAHISRSTAGVARTVATVRDFHHPTSG